MDIWSILQIQPTNDKRAIKKAYAARAKLLHPEEKPLEFEALYEAYQRALEHAGGGRGAKVRSAVPAGDSPRQTKKNAEGNAGTEAKGQPEKEAEPDGPLYSYFKDVLENEKRLFEILLSQWDAVERDGWKEEAQAAWEKYLSSEDFKAIQWNPLAVEFLAQRTAASQKRFYWAQGQPFLALWEAYGFREEGGKDGREELNRLYKGLYPAFAERKRKWLETQREIERELASWRQDRLIRRAALIGVMLLAIAAAAWLCSTLTAPRRAVERHLKMEYPGTEFSKPVKNKDGSYSFQSKSYPEIKASARAEKILGYTVIEDYGSQLLGFCAAEHGMDLEFGYMEEEGLYVLYYPDIEEAEAFCALLEDLLKEDKLAFAGKIGFCPKGALYPRQAVTGGDCGFLEGPVYRTIDPVEAGKLAEDVKTAWADYMFNYEPWNLTKEQREKWEPGYTERAQAAGDKGKVRLLTVTVVESAEGQPSETYIPVYSRTKYEHTGVSGFYSGGTASWETPYITIGSAYRLFKATGASVTVNGDGSGFTVLDASGQPQAYKGFYETELSNVKEALNAE